jgi:hypothetical protein
MKDLILVVGTAVLVVGILWRIFRRRPVVYGLGPCHDQPQADWETVERAARRMNVYAQSIARSPSLEQAPGETDELYIERFQARREEQRPREARSGLIDCGLSPLEADEYLIRHYPEYQPPAP